MSLPLRPLYGVKYQIGEEIHRFFKQRSPTYFIRKWSELGAIEHALKRIDNGACHAWIVAPDGVEHEVKIP